MKIFRQRRGLSLTELAELIDFSRGHISNVERGVRTPTTDFAVACDRTLRTDGELTALLPGTKAMSRPRTVARPVQLPPALGHFVGRSELLSQLDDVLHRLTLGESIPAVCITGPPGVGKTALAVWWAHRVLAHFPAGVLFADLHGFATRPQPADPLEVMNGFLSALGVPHDHPDDIEQAAALLRSTLYGTRTLIVCDNAANAEQVRQFMPGSPGCLLLVTSRDHLPGLVVRDGAARVMVDRFTETDALHLLGLVIGPQRLAAEPEAAASLVQRCGHLPLAVRIAAERIATRSNLTLTQLADDLAHRDHVLNVLTTSDDNAAVRRVFSWSYDTLPGPLAHLFRVLGLHPAPSMDTGAAAALAGTSHERVEPMLHTLTGTHLVERSGPGRFRMHDLVHAYAAERVLSETEAHRRTAVHRLLNWYLYSAANATRTLLPTGRHPVLKPAPADCVPEAFLSRSAALAWCDRNLDNLAAAVRLATVFDPYVADMLPIVLWDYYHRRKRPGSAEVAPRPAAGADPVEQPRSEGPRPLGFDLREHRWVTEPREDMLPLPPLHGELTIDRAELERAGDDFGHRVRRYPIAVLKPGTVDDISAIIEFARACGLPVAPRGQGYSTEGLSQAPSGIVIDMATLNTVHAVEAEKLVVDGGTRWSAVLAATLPRGLTPPVLTNYLEVSVGGSLSVGGISGASHRHGTQTDSVLELQVLTSDGELRTCSPDRERELFDRVRAGYGRHGIIARATLGLVPAPMQVRRYFLGYSDLDTFLTDQQRLVTEARFSYLEGQAQYDSECEEWHYLIEAAVYYTPPSTPDNDAMLEGLQWTRGIEEIDNCTYSEFLHRLAPSESLLRSIGSWQNQPHPWTNVLLPASQARTVIADTLRDLTPEDIGIGGVVPVYPLRTDRLRTPRFRRPQETVAFLFGLLRTAPPDDSATLDAMLEGNEQLRHRTEQVGGVSLGPPAAERESHAGSG